MPDDLKLNGMNGGACGTSDLKNATGKMTTLYNERGIMRETMSKLITRTAFIRP
jgi:hypothetical protein